MSRALILLVWNEIDGVRHYLPILPTNVADEVVAVDPGSTDGTIEALEAAAIPVLRQQRRGRGEAFRVAVARTTAEHLVFFSPDGNEDANDIPKLFEQLEQGADMAIASRFLPGARNEEDDAWLPLRKWVNMAFTLIANLVWNRSGRYVTDTINGFRGIRRSAFQAVSPQSMGYTIEYELTIGALRRGLKIVEIPTREGDRLAGETKGPSLQVGITFVRLLFKELLGGRN